MFKKITLVLNFLIIVALGVNAQSLNWNKNLVIAHRGAWKTKSLPQNSIASLKEAFRLNCYGSEFDVHLTADSIPVVNHDADFLGIKIETSTYAQLLEKELPNGEKIPTLEAFIKEGLKQNKTKLILELKPSVVSKERGQLLATIAVKMVDRLNAKKWVDYISFDYDMLKKIIELDPKAHVQYLKGEIDPDQLLKDKMSGLDYHHSVFKKNPTWIEMAKKNKLVSNVWTVNSEEDFKYFLNQKVDLITTDEPELLLKLIKK